MADKEKKDAFVKSLEDAGFTVTLDQKKIQNETAIIDRAVINQLLQTIQTLGKKEENHEKMSEQVEATLDQILLKNPNLTTEQQRAICNDLIEFAPNTKAKEALEKTFKIIIGQEYTAPLSQDEMLEKEKISKTIATFTESMNKIAPEIQEHNNAYSLIELNKIDRLVKDISLLEKEENNHTSMCEIAEKAFDHIASRAQSLTESQSQEIADAIINIASDGLAKDALKGAFEKKIHSRYHALAIEDNPETLLKDIVTIISGYSDTDNLSYKMNTKNFLEDDREKLSALSKNMQATLNNNDIDIVAKADSISSQITEMQQFVAGIVVKSEQDTKLNKFQKFLTSSLDLIGSLKIDKDTNKITFDEKAKQQFSEAKSQMSKKIYLNKEDKAKAVAAAAKISGSLAKTHEMSTNIRNLAKKQENQR